MNPKSRKDTPLAPVVPRAPGKRITWTGLRGSADALALSSAAARHPVPMLVVARDEHHAYRLDEELRFFAPVGLPVLHFPDWETLPYDLFSPHQDIVSERLAILHSLPRLENGLVVVAADTLLQRLPPRSFLDAHVFLIKPGDTLNPLQQRHRLQQAGYDAVPEVQGPGEYAVRGNLLDIFPMGSSSPFRIDLFDNQVDNIRRFDPETQRTVDQVEEIRLLPGREFPLNGDAIEAFRGRYRAALPGNPANSHIYNQVSRGIAPGGIEYYLPLFFEETASLIDFLPAKATAVWWNEADTALQAAFGQVETRYQERRGYLERPLLPPATAFHSPAGIKEGLGRLAQVQILEAARQDDAVDFGTRAPNRPDGTDTEAGLRALIEDFAGRSLLASESAGHREQLLESLRPLEIKPHSYEGWQDFIEGDQPLGLCLGRLEAGLVMTEPAVQLIPDTLLLAEHAPTRQPHKRARDPEQVLMDLTDLAIGAPVVHVDHGVGRYLGLQHLNVGGVEREFLAIEYAGSDKLYVPVAALELVHRYTGAEPDAAPLHSLGRDQWQKAKRRAAKRARDVAAELLEVHAQRAAAAGISFEIDEQAYRQFCAGFPFTETEDQAAAIGAVLKDLRSSRPADRVVCGDVGFGKTEVALRAAFVAVDNGYQVCILVPTTLLAQQHYQTFCDRFADWPVNIALLSRMRSRSQQKENLADLAGGKIDIVIGTHRLLQRDVAFNKLGLLIVDEEHRFGVRQKERIKRLRAQVDMLTLTATPIPRTLNMSLAGLRDLSIIATAPERRLAIQTFIAEWDSSLIHEACLREIRRGGQVYFLHNRVEDIERIARAVGEVVPEADIRIAHGQMRERELERVMLDFYHQRFNVLVCTTIIESGIDVPSANTIVVNRADRFGLAQLHQLRGRVGRSHHRAYAYLLVPDKRALKSDAEQRLEAIAALTELGSGFTLATHDMEIRGVGELLGDEQSGQIEEIGFTLYNKLLERAVAAVKRGDLPDPEPEFGHGIEADLGAAALLPEDYVPDVHLRLVLYKRISETKSEAGLRELKVELIDRFGLLPEPAENLFRIAELKLLSAPLGVTKLEAGAEGGRIVFAEAAEVDAPALVRLVQSDPKTYRMQGADTLVVERRLGNPEARFDVLRELLILLTPEPESAAA